mgnify:CR=1 FL=1
MTTPQTVIATWLLGVAAQFERLGIPFDELGAGLGPLTRGLAAPTRQLQLVQVRREQLKTASALLDDALKLL